MNDKIKLDSIEDAIADFKEGKFLIVVCADYASALQGT